MRSLLYLVILGIAVAVVIWGLQRIRTRPRLSTSRPAVALPAPVDYREERVVAAFGPDRGPGQLRLTASQIIFTADSGRIVTIERIDITGATETRELPDRTVARNVLAITTIHDVFYFSVTAPQDWISLLN
ncbi:MAG: hypothetical protein V9E98_01250 [Candidatus Nanopelagicales bacterium]